MATIVAFKARWYEQIEVPEEDDEEEDENV